ncbi:MAG: V-type ATP synthase subunit D [Verrucomicrobia bacterium]|nr:V-type ATP synthase subunit D [Verrucomicrobiota bacterium]
MAEIKLTKNELRAQQLRLAQLEKYLPTLQLKKGMLQTEVYEAKLELEERLGELQEAKERCDRFAFLLDAQLSIDLSLVAQIEEVHKRQENVAGIEIPVLDKVVFKKVEYTLFDTPPWVDAAMEQERKRVEALVRSEVAKEKVGALEAELRQVSIRVNLFEKVLIPRAKANIKKIKIFLGDQELAAVSQAKVAKAKIVARKGA